MTALSEHLSAGRLDVTEYGDRSARLGTAKTRGELTELFADLPEPRPHFDSAANAPAAPAARPPGGAAQVLPYLLPIAFVAALVAAFIWAPGVAWFLLLFGSPMVAAQTKRLTDRGSRTEPGGEVEPNRG